MKVRDKSCLIVYKFVNLLEKRIEYLCSLLEDEDLNIDCGRDVILGDIDMYASALRDIKILIGACV